MADKTSEELEAFKKFTKKKENGEKAQISGGSRPCRLAPATRREHGLKKASFSMDPLFAR